MTKLERVPQQVQQLKALSAEHAKRSKRRTRRQIGAVGRDTLITGVVLGLAHVLRTHPDAIHQAAAMLPQAASDGLLSAQNAVNTVSNTISTTMDTVGHTLNNIPLFGFGFNAGGQVLDAAPHALATLEDQTSVGRVLSEKDLIAAQLIVVPDFLRRTSRQVERNGKFKRDNSRMGYVDRLGFSIVHGKEEIQSSKWAELLSMGDPRGDVQKIFDKPKNFWNKRRIEYIIEHGVAEAIAADKKGSVMQKLLSPSVLAQAGGEVIEQGAKLSALHVAGLLGAALVSAATWAAYLGYSMYSAIKTGSPEKIKIAFGAFFPTVVPTIAIVTGPLFTISAEVSQHKYDKRVGSEFIAGLGEMAKKDPRSLTPKESDTLRIAYGAFSRDLPKRIQRKGEAKKVADVAVGLAAVIQDLSPEKNAGNQEYRDLNGRVKQLEAVLDQDLSKMSDMEKRGLIYRFRHGRGMRILANRISRQHKEMYDAMQQRYDNFDHAYQLAVTLQDIYRRSPSYKPTSNGDSN